jgi:Tol biopolymer transport system component
MKRTKDQIMALLVLVWISSLGLCATPFAVGPYLGQTPPGPVAQVFAPGLICDTRPHQWECHGHFSADGNTFCFRRFGYVYLTENTAQGWTTPQRITSIPYRSWSCCLSPDANSIYFLDQYFTRPARSRADPHKRRAYHRCLRTPQGWSWPQELGLPFSSAAGGFSMATDGSLCFKSRQDGFCIAPLVGNTWNRAVKIPLEFDHLNPCHPGIAPDGSFLVFYSIEPGAQGGTPTDLYLTLRRPDDTWTKPQRMGPGINTGYHEIAPRISPDKKYMFFTRSTGWNLNPATDTADIYSVELKEYLPESYR